MTEWKDRSEYGLIIKTLIDDLVKEKDQAKDVKDKIKLSHAVAYLIQTQSALLNSEKVLEDRIEELEKRAMIAKKGKNELRR